MYCKAQHRPPNSSTLPYNQPPSHPKLRLVTFWWRSGGILVAFWQSYLMIIIRWNLVRS